MSNLLVTGGRSWLAIDITEMMDNAIHVTSIPPINSLNEFIFKTLVCDFDLLVLIIVGESFLNFLENVQ